MRLVRARSRRDDDGLGLGSSSGLTLLALQLLFGLLGVDGDLDGNRAAGDFLALESGDRLLLLLLGANIDEAVALRLAGLAPATANDTGAVDLDAGVSEERSKASIVDVEAKVGDEENGLARLAGRLLSRSTGGTGRLLLLGLGRGGLALGGGSAVSGGSVAFSLGLLLCTRMTRDQREDTMIKGRSNIQPSWTSSSWASRRPRARRRPRQRSHRRPQRR